MSSCLRRYSVFNLNTLDACWIAVDEWSNSSRCRIISVYLSRTWCLYKWSCLDILITMRFSINCSTVICSPTINYAILREATSETYGPGVYFPSYKFLIYNSSLLFTFFCNLLLSFPNQKYQKYYFNVYPSISDLTLQITVKGLTTPLSRWVQFYLIDCVGIQRFVRCLQLDWYLGSQTEGNTYLYFAASPCLLQGKNKRKFKR